MPIHHLSATFAALADPTRRAILTRLSSGESSVKDLARPFKMTMPAISKHLKVLETAGLIERGRQAQWRPCRLHAAALKSASEWIEHFREFWEERLDRQGNDLHDIQGKEKSGFRPARMSPSAHLANAKCCELTSRLPRMPGDPAGDRGSAGGAVRSAVDGGVQIVAQNDCRPRIKRREFLQLATAAAIVAPAGFIAQPARKERAMSSGGFSQSRLELMHEVMSGYVKRGDLPGLVFNFSRRGEVHFNAIGTMAIDGRQPMRRDTIFRIASLTKPVVAVAALILVEECKLRLDEPVDRLLPELAGRKVLKKIDGPLGETVPANRPITLRDLLTFRMGFGIIMVPPGTYPIQRAAAEQGIRMGPPRPQEQPAPDVWMRGLGKLPLMYQPGERWLYDTGSDVLGVLIARAAPQPSGNILARTHLRTTRHEEHRFPRPAGSDRAAGNQLQSEFQHGRSGSLR